MISDFQVTIS